MRETKNLKAYIHFGMQFSHSCAQLYGALSHIGGVKFGGAMKF